MTTRLILTALVVLLGCHAEEPPSEPGWHVEEVMLFEELFPLAEAIRLRSDSTDPIAAVTAVTGWGTDIAIVDGIQSNVKVFRPDGSLKMTLGRPGTGPGELRRPTAAAARGDGTLAVLDRSSRLTIYGAESDFRATAVVPIGRAVALAPGVARDELVATGSLGPFAANSEDAVPFVHRLDFQGALVESALRMSPAPLAHPIEVTYLSFSADVRDGRIAGRWISRPLLFVSEFGSSAIDTIPLTDPRYVPISWDTWPDGTAAERLDWYRRQEWIRAPAWLRSSLVLVGHGPLRTNELNNVQSYSVIDLAERTIQPLSDTYASFGDVSGGVVLFTRWEADGTVIVERRSLAEHLRRGLEHGPDE